MTENLPEIHLGTIYTRRNFSTLSSSYYDIVTFMESIILINKPVSETPYQAIQKYRALHPEFNGVKLGYAGRLDPMAEGLLLVLVGDENKRRKSYEALPKVYEFSCLLGITTDTYDILGIPHMTNTKVLHKVPTQNIKKTISKLSQITEQEYPPYSSKPVNGIPLYKWARDGKLSEITLPKHNVLITNLELIKETSLHTSDLLTYINTRISALSGNFRQDTILTTWEELLTKSNNIFPVLNLTMTCTSGTYVRKLVSDLGEKLGTGAVTLSIKRTHVGDFSLEEVLKT